MNRSFGPSAASARSKRPVSRVEVLCLVDDYVVGEMAAAGFCSHRAALRQLAPAPRGS